MQNKRQNASQPSYRKQLIQLAKFYGIVEIKNYFKSAKRLTCLLYTSDAADE